MKIVIVGAGSIGSRHGRLLHDLAAPQILVVDPDDERRAQFLRTVPARAVASLALALDEHPDAAIICSPTSMHVSQCLQALRANCHVLVEKPISNSLDGIGVLAREAQSRKRAVLVSCNFRFDPALSQMKTWIESGLVGSILTCRATYGQDLRKCRPNRDYRSVYASSKKLGGGVILDSVHEIDYLSWFFGSIDSVSAMAAKLSDLEMDAEDSANLLLRFKSGVRAVVQLDYFRPEYNRSCEVIGTKGIIQWSYSPKVLRYFSGQTGLWSTRAMDDDAAADIMYSQQLQHFLDCIAGTATPAQGITDAAEALLVAQAALQSAENRLELPVSPAGREISLRGQNKERARPLHRPVLPSRTIAIIQARMTSSRLPGKVLADIGGQPMLSRVISRVKRATSVSEIVVAAPAASSSDSITSVCATLGITCFRGSELDVLDRYYRCAEQAGADVVVRITADCPLIDPQLIDQVIHAFLTTAVDYASNRRYGSPQALNSYPDGLDVEVFTFEALRRAHEEATSRYEREHVTPFIWRNFNRFRVLYTQSPMEFAQRQWTVDYPQDLEFVRMVYDRLGNDTFGMTEVLQLLAKEPDLSRVNGHIVPQGDWRYSLRYNGV
jgi:spore coat polysaccharide biosynthesis protein SpsF